MGLLRGIWLWKGAIALKIGCSNQSRGGGGALVDSQTSSGDTRKDVVDLPNLGGIYGKFLSSKIVILLRCCKCKGAFLLEKVI